MEIQEPIDLHRQRDFSAKVSMTFEFVKRNFKSLIRALLTIAGPPLLIGSIFISGIYGKFISTAFSAGSNPQGADALFENYFLSLGFWLQLIGGLLFMYSGIAVTIAVVYNFIKEYEARTTGPIPTAAVWDRVVKSFPMFLGTMILLTLLLVAAYAVFGLLAFMLGAAVPVLMVFVMIGLFVFMIYVSINLTFVFFIRSYENSGFFDAVRRSFTLIKGKWWSTFGLLLVMSIIQSSMASVFFVPWYINLFIQALHSTESGLQEPSFIANLFNQLFLMLYFLSSYLLYALPLIAIAFQYFNLVELKEAKGLLSKLETLGQSQPTARQDEHY